MLMGKRNLIYLCILNILIVKPDIQNILGVPPSIQLYKNLILSFKS
jgi:hypothetical protein